MLSLRLHGDESTSDQAPHRILSQRTQTGIAESTAFKYSAVHHSLSGVYHAQYTASVVRAALPVAPSLTLADSDVIGGGTSIKTPQRQRAADVLQVLNDTAAAPARLRWTYKRDTHAFGYAVALCTAYKKIILCGC